MFRPIPGTLEHINKRKAIKICLGGRTNYHEGVPLLNWEMCIERVPLVTESNIFPLCSYNSCYFKLKLLLDYDLLN